MAEIVSVPEDSGRYLVCSRYRGQFQPGWFYPEFWQPSIMPVSSGGRGGAWFIDSPDGPWVLRHYLRGGLIARVLSHHYLYTGGSRVRSFQELELLEQMYGEGLPVPEPIAAVCNRRWGLYYSCAILMKRLPGTVPMGDLLETLPLSRWRDVGAVIRRFHEGNVNHADLNCFNILISEENIYVIDFDKGRRVPASEPEAAWKRANLERLKRSVVKVIGADNSELNSRWSSLLAGYHQA